MIPQPGHETAVLTMPQTLTAAVLGIGISILCVSLVLLFSRRGNLRLLSERGSVRPTNSVFVFDEQHLVSAMPEWRAELSRGERNGSDWEMLHERLAPRFPGMPLLPELPKGEPFRTLPAHYPGDHAILRLRRIGDRIRLTLREAAPASLPDRHNAYIFGQEVRHLVNALEQIPVPIWTMTSSGQVLRKNAAYHLLEEQLSGSSDVTSPLVRDAEADDNKSHFTYRIMLDPRGRLPERWFDVTAKRSEDGWQCSAQDVTALVRAEQAQRNLVQTLTKTFAQLSAGLAIFDRDRHLILFNPALVSLTSLSPEFLTSRPSLTMFFDNLREQRIMPEPKNYANWREQLRDLVSAASDGRYQETWSLPSGATYRITGRPHPNGAVAFLLEDISDEITLTRQFRQQLTLSQSVLDAMPDAIVIFDSQGMMSYCNAAYRAFFAIDPQAALNQISAREAHRMWSRRATGGEGLEELLRQLTARGTRDPWCGTLNLRDAGTVTSRLVTLAGGDCMVTFGICQKADQKDQTAAE